MSAPAAPTAPAGDSGAGEGEGVCCPAALAVRSKDKVAFLTALEDPSAVHSEEVLDACLAAGGPMTSFVLSVLSGGAGGLKGSFRQHRRRLLLTAVRDLRHDVAEAALSAGGDEACSDDELGVAVSLCVAVGASHNAMLRTLLSYCSAPDAGLRRGAHCLPSQPRGRAVAPGELPTPLCIAAHEKNWGAAELLVRAGADPNAARCSTATPFTIAWHTPGSPRGLLADMLRCGANLHAADACRDFGVGSLCQVPLASVAPALGAPLPPSPWALDPTLPTLLDATAASWAQGWAPERNGEYPLGLRRAAALLFGVALLRRPPVPAPAAPGRASLSAQIAMGTPWREVLSGTRAPAPPGEQAADALRLPCDLACGVMAFVSPLWYVTRPAAPAP